MHTNQQSTELEIDLVSGVESSNSDDFASLVSRADEPESKETLPHTEPGGLRLGTLVAIGEAGAPLVALSGSDKADAIASRSIVTCDHKHIGRDVVLGFEGGNLQQPIQLGFLDEAAPPSAEDPIAAKDLDKNPLDLSVDNQRLELTAEREIVLRCGKASITLTRAGKVLIRGAFLLSRSSGVNRIKGGSVQIN